MSVTKKIIVVLILALSAGGGGLAFYHKGSVDALAQDSGPPPPMLVDFQEIKAQSVEIWKNFSGNVVAVDRADIRPQVEGRITEIKFTDGQFVNKGDVLIVIDPRPYEANLNQAKAIFDNTKIQADLAEKEFNRAKSLIKTDAISQSVMDAREKDHRASLAAVQGAEAAVQRAEIDLDFAYVKAPISGQISRAEITVGNLVQKAPNAPLLTTIVAQDNVYVDFEVDERTYLESVRVLKGAEHSQIPVRIKLQSSGHECDGVVHSFDNRIDAASGTIRARAIFENKDGLLLPGMAVSVEMGGSSAEKKILISETAIGTDQDRKFVLVIGEGNAATYREVEIGPSVGGQRVVIVGLSEGDRVITTGIMRIRPGMIVAPKVPGEETARQAEIPTDQH